MHELIGMDRHGILWNELSRQNSKVFTCGGSSDYMDTDWYLALVGADNLPASIPFLVFKRFRSESDGGAAHTHVGHFHCHKQRQPVLSGVPVAGGWQAAVAYVNIACYYLFGIPLGLLLGEFGWE
ncbi:hypothetical protein VNO78_27096 [Psophocarpus tetragonolobus]|uniref:Uncharacterized protein n=1 Tax=Psophocarpus tetragonolobus TaxID=3891 RepID=A0AAN9X9Z5_PSOTE